MSINIEPSVWSVIVVGAGAAGSLAGIFSARNGARTLVVDARRHPGAKIRVSGGGRCNVMPQVVDEGDFVTSGSSKIVRNLLRSWPVTEVRAYFETTLGVPLIDEVPAKVFPKSGQSRDVVEALYRELKEAGAKLQTGWRVRQVEWSATSKLFRLESDEGAILFCTKLVLATGGLSMPTTGSDGSGFRLAHGFSHERLPTRPALVPFLGQTEALASLAGLSVPVLLTLRGPRAKLFHWRGPLLFTHRGVSGPVVLDASMQFDAATANETSVTCAFGDFASEADAQAVWTERLNRARAKTVLQVVREHLPRRLADALTALAPELAPLRDSRACELSRQERTGLLARLISCKLSVERTEGYKTAEVTLGGIPLEEVHGRTLQSRKQEGLYFAGEMLDVTGRLGGFNFQWAWVSGRRAGESAANATKCQTMV